MDAAEAIAPACTYNVNMATGAVEYFDGTIGVWKSSGGEHYISGKALCTFLQEHIYSFEMTAGVNSH